MELWPEVRAAVAVATRWRAAGRTLPRTMLAAGLAWLPALGAGVGLAAAAVASLVEPLGSLAAALGGVAALVLCSGRRLSAVTLAGAAGSGAALVLLPAGARPLALVLAAMLARWAVVVQCHGGAPAEGGRGSVLVGRARFREFGIASVTAIGGALVAASALGLVAVLAAALVTLTIRLLAYRRARGLAAADLEWTEAAVEAIVLAAIAAVGRLVG